MAYVTQYSTPFTNHLLDTIHIDFKRKNGADIAVTEYPVTEVTLRYESNSEDILKPIHGMSLTVQFWLRPTAPNYWDDFINAEKDEWLVEVRVDDRKMPLFYGYVLPDMGKVPFQDQPYAATLIATDGIGTLKELPLRRPDGSEFRGIEKLIKYIAAALQQTGHKLPIRVIDNMDHASINNRNTDINADFVNQVYLDDRSFLKDPVTFLSAYEALEMILKENYKLFQWQGMWVIVRVGMLQRTPFVGYYTDYDFNGENPRGFSINDNYATIGKHDLIFPINEDQLKGAMPAALSTKTIFNYNIFPELPRNNKFTRGAGMGTGIAYDEEDADNDGNTTEVYGTYQDRSIYDWEFGAVAGAYGVLPFNLNPVNEKAYVRKIFNQLRVETNRTVFIHKPLAGAVSWLRSGGVPVIKGDKVSFSCQFKHAPGTSNIDLAVAANIYIVAGNGTTYYNLFSNNQGVRWDKNNLTNGGIMFDYAATGASPTEWNGVDVESTVIPTDGTLFIVFPVSGDINGPWKAYKDFQFEYIPYIAGGYVRVSGDYWETTQNNKALLDKNEYTTGLSDNPHAVFKGCLLDSDGVPLTPRFRRLGVNESRSYSELANFTRFNLEHRRFWDLEGTFKGMYCNAQNNQLVYLPIALHYPFRLTDIPNEDRRFLIVPPLEMNLIEGQIKALHLQEVYRDGGETYKRTETLWEFIQRFVQQINGITQGEWNSAGGAPAPGTTGFPPLAFTSADPGGDFWLEDRQDAFGVRLNAGNNITIASTNMGGGGMPGVEKFYDQDLGDGQRVCLFSITGPIAVGHIITLHVYNRNVGGAVTRIDVPVPGDGEILDGAQIYDWIYSDSSNGG